MSKQSYTNANLIAALTEEVTCFHKQFDKPKPMPTYWALAEEVTHLHGQLYKLKAENKKLRELIKELYEDAWLEYPSAFESNYLERIKAFGIEVDQ